MGGEFLHHHYNVAGSLCTRQSCSLAHVSLEIANMIFVFVGIMFFSVHVNKDIFFLNRQTVTLV